MYISGPTITNANKTSIQKKDQYIMPAVSTILMMMNNFLMGLGDGIEQVKLCAGKHQTQGYFLLVTMC
jgi:hypothetical protein